MYSSISNSDDRRRYIANLFAEGMDGDEFKKIEAERIMKLISEISDDQIIILSSYLDKFMHDREFNERHAGILDPVELNSCSSMEQDDRFTLRELMEDSLIRLGLIKYRFKNYSKGDVPEFDGDTGTIKPSGKMLTPLGRLVLARIGIAGENDF